MTTKTGEFCVWVRLDIEFHQRLKQAVEAERKKLGLDVSKSAFIRRAIKDYLDRNYPVRPDAVGLRAHGIS